MARRKTKQAPKKGKKAAAKKKPKRTAPDWAPAFLAALAVTGNISDACQAAGVKARSTFYERRDNDNAFAALAAEALETSTDALELEARRRAHDGLRRVKFHQGEPIMVQALGPDGRPLKARGQPVLVPYVEHEYSDTLLIFLLKAHRPEKYRDKVDHTVTVSPKVIEVVVDGPDHV
jgi:hypothetical protein